MKKKENQGETRQSKRRKGEGKGKEEEATE